MLLNLASCEASSSRGDLLVTSESKDLSSPLVDEISGEEPWVDGGVAYSDNEPFPGSDVSLIFQKVGTFWDNSIRFPARWNDTALFLEGTADFSMDTWVYFTEEPGRFHLGTYLSSIGYDGWSWFVERNSGAVRV